MRVVFEVQAIYLLALRPNEFLDQVWFQKQVSMNASFLRHNMTMLCTLLQSLILNIADHLHSF